MSVSICEMCWFIFSNMFPVLLHMWAILLFYQSGINSEVANEKEEAYFECGAHGRFEYCIEGIPGCVIGCHCYPGYYFDTDTKICEPNIKLTQDYRRHNMLEPTRLPDFTPMDINPTPTTTTINPVEEKVNAITNDTDDLGDWLYNQFFKTIENQVINSTDDRKITRRSGGGLVAKPIPKSLRRSHRKRKHRSKRKRYKKRGLKRKLLRITEDDSLFDSSSTSSESRSSSSESSSGSGSGRSVESAEENTEHGHRKILMVNKRPTPPLPSFIFLPNVETPFYPPIGLPPPPIMPMYPMVPVPPVGAFIPGYPVNCNDSETTLAPVTTPTTHSEFTTPPIPTIPSTLDPSAGRMGKAKDAPDDPSKKSYKSNKPGGRNKIMQKIREKMKRRDKIPTPPTSFGDDAYHNTEASYWTEAEQPLIESLRARDIYDPDPPLLGVDFKYLSQLIHKMDLNKTKPDKLFKMKQRMIDLPNPPYISRRSYPNSPPVYYNSPQKLRPASKADDVNESYYSNLGRQIASLIRKVDSEGERQINIEIEQQNQVPMFNENRYSPQSYWERFVRSPQRQSYVENMNHLKNSNENLFNLENQVRIANVIERTLSLQELENIANVMERSQSRSNARSSKNVTPATNSRSYNINLLPQPTRRANPVIQFDNRGIQNNTPMTQINEDRNVHSTGHYNNYPTQISQNFIRSKRFNETHRNASMLSSNYNHIDFLHNVLKSRHKTPFHHQVSKIMLKNITNGPPLSTRQPLNFEYDPLLFNYKSVKYVGRNHNQYQGQHGYIPFQLPFLTKAAVQATGRRDRPSYFHHEFHHFDYFD